MSPATVTEIYEIIQNFNNDKANDISIFVLKKCSNVICAKLTRFINSFMDEGYFPEVLKIGKITPIYKKDNPQRYEITDQCLCYLYSVKYSKKLFIVGYITL